MSDFALNKLSQRRSRCERLGREAQVQFDRLGLTLEGLLLATAGMPRLFHQDPQPVQDGPGLVWLAEPVVGDAGRPGLPVAIPAPL